MHDPVSFNGREWSVRPHEPGEPARYTSQLSDEAGFTHSRANLWRYEPGARGRRHVHADQEETFVVLEGTMTIAVGEPPEVVEVASSGLIHVDAGTPLQVANRGDDELLLYVYGSPPDFGADVLPGAL